MFLERYRKATGYIYRCGVLEFLDFINGKRMRGFNCTTDEFQQYEQFARDYLTGKRDKARDFFLFVKKMDEKKVAPKTAHTRYIAVREWMKFHDIVIPDKIRDDAKRLKPKGGRRTNFEYFDRKTIGEILAHGDARFRAFVLVLASSGIRLGEALNLKWRDLNIPDRLKYPERPASLFIAESKTGNSRKVYISREAEAALDEWRKVIPKYRAVAEKKARNLGKEASHDKDAMFPISETVVYELWDGVLRDAGLMNKDERTNRTRLNIHRLRNFFSVQVASVNKDVAEMLMGHSDQYGGAYTGRPDAEIEEVYRQAEPLLSISGATGRSAEIEELRRENADLRQKMEDIGPVQDDIRTLREENQKLKTMMDGLFVQLAHMADIADPTGKLKPDRKK
ncbi:MAG: site-specific tyrosine recombinase XerC [Methanoregula sp. PtaU1.Bin006]|nr:MAG: site-specific tyrosine recombinase XerC [Methanoregula sp. PtaB.Bin085]OPY35211.1 MAG: site-specific tyrosine recombinase XerC [Methanoregula sp. PtaU1.Bin006]